ncbi:MAG: ABC transporter ATP-binding protein [Candidatus Riflebacteria bacterium]|nr:ABC transporter ATP-binding protein [Candidatus Riflebacteria bacterium]
MIELEAIEKTYDGVAVRTAVLKGVSFRVARGEYVAIMGTSGTGKSTLMNILGCLDRPTAGRYRLDDTDVADLDDDQLSRVRNSKIGFVFQQFHLLDQTSALQNVLLPLIYAEKYPEDARQRAQSALTDMGLADRMTYRPGELSGGQQQRVAIARALITDPALILADEPTGNLDSESGAEVMAIFGRLHRRGRTIVLVTHDRSVAEHSHRIIVLKDGTIAEDSPVAEPRVAEVAPDETRGQEATR